MDKLKRRLQEMEEEAAALREMQAKVENQMGAAQDPAKVASTVDGMEEVDSRSIYVGNGHLILNSTWNCCLNYVMMGGNQ
nr:polyadenylate-binding protein 2 [Ipomoea batatas]